MIRNTAWRLLNNLGKMKIYIHIFKSSKTQLWKQMSSLMIRCWNGLNKLLYRLKKRASSSLREPPTGASHRVSPGVSSEEQATINHWLRTFTSHFIWAFCVAVTVGLPSRVSVETTYGQKICVAAGFLGEAHLWLWRCLYKGGNVFHWGKTVLMTALSTLLHACQKAGL